MNTISGHAKENTTIGNSQYVFIKNSLYLTSSVAFYDKTMRSVDMGTPVAILHLDFSKVFDMVSHRILISRLGYSDLNGWTAKRIEKCHNDWVSKKAVNDLDSTWRSITMSCLTSLSVTWQRRPRDVLFCHPYGKQLCRKLPRSPDGKVEHELAMCPCH